MNIKIYQIVGIDTAMKMLRPGAIWEFTGGVGFTRWEDPRPCPSVEELFETIEKIKNFEDSINTIWLPEQLEEINTRNRQIQNALE